MARLLQNHPSKRRNLTRGGRKDINADSISSNEINSSSFYPSNSSRERTEYIPALNISGTSTLLDTAELETDRTSIRSSNLPGGCCSTVTIISTPTGSRNAAPAPLIMHEFVLFCGSLTTYLSFLLPSATIVKITILFAAKTSKRSIFFLCYVEKSETRQNYRLGKAEFYILDRAVESMSNKRKLNNF